MVDRIITVILALLAFILVLTLAGVIGYKVGKGGLKRPSKPNKRDLQIESQRKDFEWFLEHYNELYEKYGKCYLAIKNKKIIGIYSNYEEGVKSVQEVEPLGTFIIQYCNGDKSGYTAYIG